MTDPKSYYTEALPAQWNRSLREQERAVSSATRVLDGMRAVHATIRVAVSGEGGGEFFLNVAGGKLTPGDQPAHAPFLTLQQERADFERFVAEAGDSALGFLGGLSGLASDMKLTQARIDALADVAGTVRFTLAGDAGFQLTTHFGEGVPADPPTTEISVELTAYRALRSGELNPQDAFLDGQIRVEGDMQLAMQIALAALTPD